MTGSIAPTQDGLQIALWTFLTAILPTDVEIIQATQNRVPEPTASRFVVMTPIRMTRLRTNIDSLADVRFTGSIAADVLTISAVAFGAILVGSNVLGTGVAANTKITEKLTGPTGGTGTYRVSVSQTLSSRQLAAGNVSMEQGVGAVVQLDFHCANNTASDLAMITSTVLRDEKGVDLFAAQDPNYGVVPLYADDPRYIPFINENQQAEWRWSVDAHLQVNQITSLPQAFMDAVTVEVVSVDAAFPP